MYYGHSLWSWFVYWGFTFGPCMGNILFSSMPHLGALPEYLILLLASAWEELFVFNSIIFGLTIYNMISTRQMIGPHATILLQAVIVQDTLANLTNIATFYLGRVTDYPPFSISVAMISWLMLNVHEQAPVRVFTDHSTSFQNSIVIGSVHADEMILAF
ncbi:hypothetical protein B0H10DRAFT_1951700 [Mycena sp. CBHHK59/15]|nr:hypothetical protein B0H10DRAFT_1951700 [Mycena sp. CBHHK59/15]